MEFDRPRTKEMAKVMIRQAQPRPWKVLLVYTLIVTVVPLALFLILALSAVFHGALTSFSLSFGHHRELFLPSFELANLAAFSFQLLLFLFSALMQMGYRAYCVKLWRKESGSYRDLFAGFRIPGKTLALYGLEVLFSLLWAIPGFLVLLLMIMVTSLITDSTAVLGVLLFLGYIGFFAYLLNRILRYALAYNILLDHPDWTAREALYESKVLMANRRWSYFVLMLSFLGWSLLICCIAYLALIVATLFCSACLAPLLYGAGPVALIVLILCIFLLAFLASTPLLLWLSAYTGASTAGFYDWAIGRPLIPPAPPWQPQPSTPPESLAPPEPWNSPENL